MYDLIIKNGSLIDGTGCSAYIADIAIQGGKIVRIGTGLYGSEQVIDATGLTVTPGFIDAHSHSDLSALTFPEQIEKVEQGITTAIGGHCGDSVAPLKPNAPVSPVGALGSNTEVYKTMGSFLEYAKKVPMGANLTTFVGHNPLRLTVIGSENRAPTRQELEQMGDLLRESIAHGALGISFGLVYAPGSFAQTDELVYLATVAAECGGMISAHIRDEGDGVIEATQEFIHIVKASGVKGILSHHKAMYKQNWGKVNTTIAMIDRANREGCDIYFDTYPYTASHTSIYTKFIPKEYCSGGNDALVQRLQNPAIREEIRRRNLKKYGDDLSWCKLTVCPPYPEYLGLSINEIAQLRSSDVYDAVFDMIIASKNNCRGCNFLMCEEDLETVIAHPRCMICTDSNIRANSSVYHPRLRGSFPRALGRYVRERKTVSLPAMIRKMTSLPAAVFGIRNKGLLKEGYDADICIFDADKITDRCDFTNCHERAEGLNYVLVAGRITAENAVCNGTRAGRILI